MIFLPGILEITTLKDKIRLYSQYNTLHQSSFESENDHNADLTYLINKVSENLHTVMIHSTMNREEQDKIFENAPPNKRKIVIATNIAESSITVPDVKIVIDSCLIKDN